jgi:hypothetical protein
VILSISGFESAVEHDDMASLESNSFVRFISVTTYSAIGITGWKTPMMKERSSMRE